MTVFVRWPVDMPPGWVSQDIFVRNSWENHPHQGIDIAAPAGTPIYAPCDGFIVWASFDTFPPGNTWEMIPHNTGSGGCTILQPLAPHTALQTSFSHQSEILVRPGQFVKAGQIIGRVGSTGNSTGDHVHWEAFIDYAEGVYPAGTFYGRVDPKQYFSTATVVPLGTGGKGSANIQEDDMATPAEVWAYPIAAPSDPKRRYPAHTWLSEANEKADRAEKEARDAKKEAQQATAAVKGLLEVRIPDPDNPERSYPFREWLTRANIKAGVAADAATKLAKETK